MVLPGDHSLHHSWRGVEIPGAFEEVLDKRSVDFVAFADCCLKVVAEDAVDVSLVVFPTKEQEECVAVLTDGGAEVHQLLIHVPAAGLHLGQLEGLTEGFCGGAVLLSFFFFWQV